jgi:hypothetical protein
VTGKGHTTGIKISVASSVSFAIQDHFSVLKSLLII